MARVGLGKADRADRRLREHRRSHHVVIECSRVAVELGLSERRALADGHRGQVDPIGDIADRPDVVDIGLGIDMTGSTVKSDTAMKISYSGLEILGFGTTDGKPNREFVSVDN